VIAQRRGKHDRVNWRRELRIHRTIEELIKLLRDQLQQQKEDNDRRANQMEVQMKQHRKDMDSLINLFGAQAAITDDDDDDSHGITSHRLSCVSPQFATVPPFAAFDSTTELWPDYWSRFCTFTMANSVPEQRKAQVFLTNQTAAVYKQLANVASQQSPPKDINELAMEEILQFMKEQFDPKLFLVRERFKFWSDMQRKPGETLQELAARIRQDAATCDFKSITDPQDEALRQRFICSVNNEAVLKSLFKVRDEDLTFARAVEIALETEEAAKVAKETVYGSKHKPVYKVQSQNKVFRKNQQSSSSEKVKCYRCGKPHKATNCPYKEVKCHFCEMNIKGHLYSLFVERGVLKSVEIFRKPT